MNRLATRAALALLALALPFASAAESVDAASPLPQAENPFVSGRYEISYPEGYAGAEDTAKALNAIRSAFDRVFRFDGASGDSPARVIILADKAAFDAYVSERIGDTRNQFLFLRYADPARSELVMYPLRDAEGFEAFASPSAYRQLFLQYAYGRASEPPRWIVDGFQAVFENLAYDPKTGTVGIGPAEPWLETAKKLRADPARAIDVEGLLSAVTGDGDTADFYPQAWAFASFLLSSENPDYQRFLHECALLVAGTGQRNDSSQKELTATVRDRFAAYIDPKAADEDFSTWLASQRTFADLVQSGVAAYNAGNYRTAGADLARAAESRPGDPLVSYYRGLVAYAQKDYKSAEAWYRAALERGGDTSTVNWALGLNAYADGRYAESKVYLNTAKSANPARYGKKADEVIAAMPK